MNFKYPKTFRLRKKKEFQKVLQAKKKIKGTYCTIDFAKSEDEYSKLGISIPLSFGQAYLRNRFKRVIREIFRTSHHNLLWRVNINVSPTSLAKVAHFKHLKEEFLKLAAYIMKDISIQ